VTVSVRPLSVMRPPSLVSREQTSDCVKCDAGEVLCHQAPATQSPSTRGRVSSRYCDLPSRTTSRSPNRLSFPRTPAGSAPATITRNAPPGSACSPRSPNASG
jgi:hypothetical protein